MSTTSTVELRSLELGTHEEPHPPDWQASTAEPADPDDVIHASLLADAEVPDGGYGWVVVGGCAVVTFWFVGSTYSWGVIQKPLVDQGLAKASTLALVGSLCMAGVAIYAVLNASLIRAVGGRTVALMGMTLLSLGQLLSGFSTNSVAGLFVTTGIIMGIGCRQV